MKRQLAFLLTTCLLALGTGVAKADILSNGNLDSTSVSSQVGATPSGWIAAANRAVTGPFNFTLYAIWANNPTDPDGQYVTQVWKAIHHYNRLLTNRESILIGDFNSNTIWDKPRRAGNHSTVVEHLEKKGIHSVYHRYFKQVQGKEQHPTLYMYRKKDKAYHIDYCFVSEPIANKLKSVEVGDYDSWIKYSDHVPVIITFD